MITWIRQKLGIEKLIHTSAFTNERLKILEKKVFQLPDGVEITPDRVRKESQRYDEIERDRKRRRKG